MYSSARRNRVNRGFARLGALSAAELAASNMYFKNLALAGRSDEIASSLAYSQLPDAARGSGLQLDPRVLAQKNQVLAGDYFGAYGPQWSQMLAAAQAEVYDASNFDLPLQKLPDGGAVANPAYKPIFIDTANLPSTISTPAAPVQTVTDPETGTTVPVSSVSSIFSSIPTWALAAAAGVVVLLAVKK